MDVFTLYEPFGYTGYSFEEMIGNPKEIHSALGRVVQTFNVLDSQIAAAIALLLGVNNEIAEIVTAEMSFRNKLNLFASLVRHYTPLTKFNVGKFEQLDVLKHLMKACTTCEELRNNVVHSSWQLEENGANRCKISAKATRGLVKHSEKFTPGMLVDIGDYNIYIAECVVEFFLVIEPPLHGHSELSRID